MLSPTQETVKKPLTLAHAVLSKSLVSTPKLSLAVGLSEVEELDIIQKYISSNPDSVDLSEKVHGRSLKLSKKTTGLSHSYLIVKTETDNLVLRLSHSTDKRSKTFFKDEVVGLLGQGTFGKVKRTDSNDARNYVLKSMTVAATLSLSQQHKRIEEINSEIDIYKKLGLYIGHYFYDKDDGSKKACIIMPNLGIDLFSYIEKAKAKGWRTDSEFIISLCIKCLNEVERIHAFGIAHRDIKLENMMIDLESGEVRLCDFGNVRPLQECSYSDDDNKKLLVDGTPLYWPPEHFAMLKRFNNVNIEMIFQLLKPMMLEKDYGDFLFQIKLKLHCINRYIEQHGVRPKPLSGKCLDLYALGRMFYLFQRLANRYLTLDKESINALDLVASKMITASANHRLKDFSTIRAELEKIKEQCASQFTSVSLASAKPS